MWEGPISPQRHLLLFLVTSRFLKETQSTNATLATISGKRFDLFTHDARRSWGESRSVCRTLGGRLAAITDHNFNSQLAEAMQGMDPPVEAAWIGGTFEPSSNYWAWIGSDDRFYGTIKDANYSTHKCAYMEIHRAEGENQQGGKIGIFRADKSCNEDMLFICDSEYYSCPNQDNCTEPHSPHLLTWDKANTWCKDNARKLVTFEAYMDKNGDKPIHIMLKGDLAQLPDRNYWIGLRHKGWTWTDSNIDITYTASNITVSPDSSQPATGLCLYLDHTQQWHVLECDNVLNFICETDLPTSAPIVESIKADNWTLIAGLISGIVLTGLLAVAAMLFLVFVRRRFRITPQGTSVRRNKVTIPPSRDWKADSLAFENPYEDIDADTIRYSYTPSTGRPPADPPPRPPEYPHAKPVGEQVTHSNDNNHNLDNDYSYAGACYPGTTKTEEHISDGTDSTVQNITFHTGAPPTGTLRQFDDSSSTYTDTTLYMEPVSHEDASVCDTEQWVDTSSFGYTWSPFEKTMNDYSAAPIEQSQDEKSHDYVNSENCGDQRVPDNDDTVMVDNELYNT